MQARWGDRVMLNDGGTSGLVADVAPDGNVVVDFEIKPSLVIHPNCLTILRRALDPPPATKP